MKANMSKIVCIVTYKEITDEAKLAAYAAMAPATVEGAVRLTSPSSSI